MNPDAQVIVVGGVPQWEIGLPKRLVESGVCLAHSCDSKLLSSRLLNRVILADHMIERTLLGEKVSFLRPARVLCEASFCTALVHHMGTSMPYAWDQEHLTEGGSVHLANALFR